MPRAVLDQRCQRLHGLAQDHHNLLFQISKKTSKRIFFKYFECFGDFGI